MEDNENNNISTIVILLFLIGVIVLLLGHFILGWKVETTCPYRDRTGEWIEDC